MYTAQRYTGLIAFALHRPARNPPALHGRQLPEHPYAAFAKVQQELANPWMLAVYIVAMIAICWHFAYGVWLFAAKWGITPGKTARKRFGIVCAVMGLILAVMGLASIWAFVGGKYPNVPSDLTPAVSDSSAQLTWIADKTGLHFNNVVILSESRFLRPTQSKDLRCF